MRLTQHFIYHWRTMASTLVVMFRTSQRLRLLCYVLCGWVITITTLDMCYPPPTSIRFSQIILANDGTIIHAFLSDDDKWRMKTNIHDVSPLLIEAIIAKEDRYFRWHYGVNPVAILRALGNNIKMRRTTSGASTITMQVARLLEPKPRTFINKFREALRAVQLEWHYSKDEILELYLNLVPFGGNIEGVTAASVLYMNRMPSQLSLAQAVTLAVIPNKPTTLRIGESNSSIIQQRNKWLNYFSMMGVFSHELIHDALNEQTIIKRADAPHLAPHFALRMQRRYPSVPVVKTHLDLRCQEQAQTLAYNYIQRLRAFGIFNSSVLVINNKNQSVAAYVGSQDFTDNDHAGQVDGVQAIRSPGSTLKPLVYALGFEKGLITPKSRLYDVPISIDGYAPENFDQTFSGAVSAEDALARSLNIPAVTLLNTLGVQPFSLKLSQCGFRGISPSAKNVGLSLVLGGCGVRLEELAQLYACFAHQGIARPLHWTTADTSTSSQRILGEASSFLITDILTKLTRPDIPTTFMNTLRVPRIAWKTGTSYGRRDAWSIGYNTKYTVAVWVGNFNGEGIPTLTGSTSATPLLFDIFSAIDNSIQTEWYAPPNQVDFRIVCSETGLPPSEDCDNTITDFFIPTISNAQVCTHIKRVPISADKRFSFCTSCVPQNGYIMQKYVNYPAELVNYYNGERISIDIPPPHNPLCTRIFSESIPKITSPLDNTSYVINRKDSEPLMLAVSTASDVHTVYWYVNDKLVGAYPSQEHVFIKPRHGENKISCSDDKGRNADIKITVEWE